ncbi:MAG: cell division ATPase MinD [Candidatus Hadarchaeales archaeon]
MRIRARSISITSGKGGTGKTTLTANLGISLSTLGKRVTIIDGDLAMANLAIILGIHQVKTSFLDVLKGKADLDYAVYESRGVRVIPTGFRFEDAQEAISGIDRERVKEVVRELLKDTDFLLIDAAAGVQDATIVSIAAASEMLLVCNPTHPSIVDGYKMVRFANLLGAWTRGIVLNRVGKRSELTGKEVEQFMSRALGPIPVLAEIPEDSKVQEAENAGIPLVVYDPECSASVAIHELAKVLVGEKDLPAISGKATLSEVTRRLVRALTGTSE